MNIQAIKITLFFAISLGVAGAACAVELVPLPPNAIVSSSATEFGEEVRVQLEVSNGNISRLKFYCGKLTSAVRFSKNEDRWMVVGAVPLVSNAEHCIGYSSVNIYFEDVVTPSDLPEIRVLRVDFLGGRYVGYTQEGESGLPHPFP